MRKSPILYLILSGLCLTVALCFLLDRDKEPLAGLKNLKRNIFDENQYLFSRTDGVVPAIDLNVVEGAFLKPSAPPFLVSGKVFGALGLEGIMTKREVEEYIVEQGDTLTSIAQKFNISLETLLWANNLSSRSTISPGQKLAILPISGLMHIVRERDTLSEIAELYQAKVEDIVDFNGLEDEGKIYVGDFLIIPDGKKPKVTTQYTQVPLSQSYFICPIPSPCKITQGLHWYNAIDFGNGKCGEPVFAAAGGIVQRTGYTSVGGNYVRILHPNGVVTYYGHLSRAAVAPGQKVYQGQIVGYVGSSGVTVPAGPAGCHLHFDVRFAQNPFAKYGAGTQLAP